MALKHIIISFEKMGNNLVCGIPTFEPCPVPMPNQGLSSDPVPYSDDRIDQVLKTLYDIQTDINRMKSEHNQDSATAMVESIQGSPQIEPPGLNPIPRPLEAIKTDIDDDIELAHPVEPTVILTEYQEHDDPCVSSE